MNRVVYLNTFLPPAGGIGVRGFPCKWGKDIFARCLRHLRHGREWPRPEGGAVKVENDSIFAAQIRAVPSVYGLESTIFFRFLWGKEHPETQKMSRMVSTTTPCGSFYSSYIQAFSQVFSRYSGRRSRMAHIPRSEQRVPAFDCTASEEKAVR